jgi:hypothetical protein
MGCHERFQACYALGGPSDVALTRIGAPRPATFIGSLCLHPLARSVKGDQATTRGIDEGLGSMRQRAEAGLGFPAQLGISVPKHQPRSSFPALVSAAGASPNYGLVSSR